MIAPRCAERLRALELVTRSRKPEQVGDFFPGLFLGGYVMPLQRELGEDAAGLVRNRDSSHLIQAGIDQMFPGGRVAAVSQHPVDHGLDPGLTHIPELLRGKVDAFDQRAGINPGRALMPSLHTWRVIELLPHPGHLQGPSENLASWPVELSGQPQNTGDELRRTFHLLIANVVGLEKVSVKQDTQHQADVVVTLKIGLHESLNRLGMARRRIGPRRYRRFIGNKKVIHMSGDKARGRFLLTNDIDNVFAVKRAALPEESLFLLIMVI